MAFSETLCPVGGGGIILEEEIETLDRQIKLISRYRFVVTFLLRRQVEPAKANGAKA